MINFPEGDESTEPETSSDELTGAAESVEEIGSGNMSLSDTVAIPDPKKKPGTM